MSYSYLILNVSADICDLKYLLSDHAENSANLYKIAKNKLNKLYSELTWEQVSEDVYFGSGDVECSIEIWLFLKDPIFCFKVSAISEDEAISLGSVLDMVVFDIQTGERIFCPKTSRDEPA